MIWEAPTAFAVDLREVEVLDEPRGLSYALVDVRVESAGLLGDARGDG